MSTAASDENTPLLVPATANSWALALAVESAPLVLAIATVPVLTADTAPPSVSAVPPNETLSLPAVLLAKLSKETLRPSVVVSVMAFFALELLKVAVTPLAAATPLMALINPPRSFWSFTVADTDWPFSVKLIVPGPLRALSVVLLVAVALTPMLAPAALMELATASAPAFAG